MQCCVLGIHSNSSTVLRELLQGVCFTLIHSDLPSCLFHNSAYSFTESVKHSFLPMTVAPLLNGLFCTYTSVHYVDVGDPSNGVIQVLIHRKRDRRTVPCYRGITPPLSQLNLLPIPSCACNCNPMTFCIQFTAAACKGNDKTTHILCLLPYDSMSDREYLERY